MFFVEAGVEHAAGIFVGVVVADKNIICYDGLLAVQCVDNRLFDIGRQYVGIPLGIAFSPAPTSR
jgi:hypothetical protein